MKTVKGKWLNEKYELEINVYLDGSKFEEEETYYILENGDVENSNGDVLAYDFVREDDYNAL